MVQSADLPVVLLMGPTASGKTELAAWVSSKLAVELISVDAAQVYRGMDIGTAKAESQFLKRFPHHLIDIRNPDQPYSVAEFRHDALYLIHAIHERGRLPVLVGGAMFYFSSLEHGLSQLPSADLALRRNIAQEIAQHGLHKLYQKLIKFDPILKDRIKSGDTQRIQRATEIVRLTGERPSQLQVGSAEKLPYRILKMGLFTPNRNDLHQRISVRFAEMIEAGLIDEVESLQQQYQLNDTCPSMRSVGYRQVLAYLEHEYDKTELIKRAIAATRQLAKRQLTWMRRQSALVWIDTTHSKRNQNVVRLVSGFVSG